MFCISLPGKQGKRYAQNTSVIPVGRSARGSDELGALSSPWHLATVCTVCPGDQNVSKMTSHNSTCGVFEGGPDIPNCSALYHVSGTD